MPGACHLWSILLITGALLGVADGCPTRCLCFRTTVRCMFLNLDRIPKVPLETTILDLRFNRIRAIPPGSFSGLHQLNTLLINNNRIQRIENGAFDELPELRNLYLYKNQISSIENKAFHGIPQVEQLYLHFNELTELEPDTFSKLPLLERLFLHNNHISTLPKGLFSNLDSLKRLRLDSNALVCDCHMMWLSEMLKNNKGHTQAAVTCQSPNDVHGLSLVSIPEEHFHCRKPQLTATPHDVEVSFGNTAYFTCRAEGDPQPEIVWLHNDHEIVANSVEHPSRYSVLDDGTLMIENTQDSDQGAYECLARNVAGEAKTETAELKYVGSPAAPRMLRVPQDVTLVQGDTLTLDCAAAGHPNPEIEWTKEGLPIPPDARVTRHGFGTLVIQDVLYEDRGEYRCQASNNLGEDFATARVQIQVQPRFNQRPEDKAVIEGDQTQFTCLVHGYPTPTITWRKDGRLLPSDPRIIVSGDKSTLLFTAAVHDDQGLYECEAENIAGRKVVTAHLEVKARAPPRFVRTPTDFRVPVHGSIELECSARGDPSPTIAWYRNSVAVIANERTFISEEGDLAVYSVDFGDEGLYECAAENNVGVVRAYARVTVLEADTVYLGDPFVDQSIREAIIAVNRAFNNTLRELHNPNRRRTPHELLTLFRLPSSPQALEITRSAEIYERALDIILQHVHDAQDDGMSYDVGSKFTQYQELISPSHLAIIANLSNCAAHRRVINCSDMCFHQKYRSYDGTCNNLQHPMWGSSLTALNRLLKPAYEDGLHSPVGWDRNLEYNGFKLPSAREVSLKLISSEEVTPDEEYTHYLMQWGQFVDHDLDFSPMAVSNARFSDGRFCNETCDENQAPCFPIPVPESDPRIHRQRCLGMTRSSAMCGSGMTSVFFSKVSARQQLNQITSYMDASNVYGSSEEDAVELRDLSSQRGLLRRGMITPAAKHLLPFNVNSPVDCQIDPNTAHIPCFLAGDHRANEQLGLLATHTLWMREHNRIAEEMLVMNPHWDGDTIYHEARRIVGAQLQHITYSHWLPKILGPAGMARIPKYSGYNPNQDSSILNAFSTAAFRFGHSLINPVIYRLNETFQPTEWGNLPLHRAFFAPFRIVEEGGIDPVIRGLFGRAGKKVRPDEILNSELTERLFMLAHEVSLDLAALNLQRGRDHGLKPYNEYRQYCNLSLAETFEDFRREVSNEEVLRKLQELYGHPDNVDLWVGGLVEDPLPGSRVGPTFTCIIAEQFRRTRDGDRFWYENPGVFKPSQLTEIKQTSLARIICDNSDFIRLVQPDVFMKTEYPHGYVTCDDPKIPRVDLKLWTHCCEDCASTGEFNSLTSDIFRRRKRSADFSYADEKPLSNNIEDILNHDAHRSTTTDDDHHHGSGNSHHHTDNNLPHSNHSHHANHLYDDDFFMSHDMMDVIDTRIEGVEGVMERLGRTVRKLNKKVKSLEKQVAERPVGEAIRTCKDDYGGHREDKEQWREHDCRFCSCQSGQVECITETCPLPSCDFPKKKRGQCCPVC